MYVDRGSLAAPEAWHLDRVVAADSENAGRARCAETIEVHVYSDLGTVAQEWQAFEKRADCTVFQVFHWLLKWQQYIGARTGTIPAVVLGRDADGKVLFIFPLAIVAGGLARRLIWLGSDVCDYNAPLLADEFSRRISPDGFVGMWRRIIELIGKQPGL